MEQDEDENTSCVVCLEQFKTIIEVNEPDKRPMALICGHMICKTCYDGLPRPKKSNNGEDSSRLCPECRGQLTEREQIHSGLIKILDDIGKPKSNGREKELQTHIDELNSRIVALSKNIAGNDDVTIDNIIKECIQNVNDQRVRESKITEDRLEALRKELTAKHNNELRERLASSEKRFSDMEKNYRTQQTRADHAEMILRTRQDEISRYRNETERIQVELNIERGTNNSLRDQIQLQDRQIADYKNRSKQAAELMGFSPDNGLKFADGDRYPDRSHSAPNANNDPGFEYRYQDSNANNGSVFQNNSRYQDPYAVRHVSGSSLIEGQRKGPRFYSPNSREIARKAK